MTVADLGIPVEGRRPIGDAHIQCGRFSAKTYAKTYVKTHAKTKEFGPVERKARSGSAAG